MLLVVVFVQTLFLVSSLVIACRCDGALNAGLFDKAILCDLGDRLNLGCSGRVDANPRSLIECTSLCLQDEFCAGASLDGRGVCFLHQNCNWGVISNNSCSFQNTNHDYFIKVCVHGTWDVPSRSCHCYKGVSGGRCEIYPKDCSDWKNRGFTVEEVVPINPDGDGRTLFKVACRLVGSLVRNGVFKSEGKISFNRTWHEYVNGFFIDDLNFWSGLNAWHKLTASRDDYGITVTTMFTNGGYTSKSVLNAKVADEAHAFVLSMGGGMTSSNKNVPVSSYHGDCLNPLNGTAFSAWDRDNDGDNSTNCASLAGSGWWWGSYDNGTGSCSNPCHLLGLGQAFRSTRPAPELMYMAGMDMNLAAPHIHFVRINLV